MTAPRLKGRRGLRILPSATTVLAICAGLTSIKFALDDRSHIALALIGAAAVLDGIDGGIARALDAQSRMGAEIDSLADAVNFGVAPALVVYVTLLPTSPIGWICVLIYAVCVVLRLARFNALLDDDTRPAYTRQYFTGMPAPCGAIGSIAPMAAMLQFGQGWWTSQWFVCLWLVANAALLVSRVPTLALKAISV
ncbi:MAG TPA: phosphatidylcholine/phosphatidylserine synthase, partial [Mycobacterium sp.]|nr:phosphatidylcholine/phosphatidylserine synthase [Mycobacterium sp.]